jgi:ribosomal protein S18 acetylase RimI-like enzyme
MSILIIQRVTIEDLERLCEIEKECFALEAFSKEQLIYLLGSPNSLSLKALVDNEIAGFTIGVIEKRNKIKAGHIFTLDVASKYRRKGVGQQLLQEFERILRERGGVRCQLEVRADNVAALELYHKNEYVKVEQLKNYYQQGIDGIRLKKAL